MGDLPLADCEFCGKMSKNRVPQLFSAIDKTPKTLGSWADTQRSNMSEAEYSERVQKMANERKQLINYAGKIPEGSSLVNKPSNEPKWFRPDMNTPDTKLLKASPEKINDYIMTGKRPFGTT